MNNIDKNKERQDVTCSEGEAVTELSPSSGSPKLLECHFHPFEDRLFISNPNNEEMTQKQFLEFVELVNDVLSIKNDGKISGITSVGLK